MSDADNSDLHQIQDKSYEVLLNEEVLKTQDFPELRARPDVEVIRYTLLIKGPRSNTIVWQKLFVDYFSKSNIYKFHKIHLLNSLVSGDDVYIVYKNYEYTYLDVYKIVSSTLVLVDSEMIPVVKNGFQLPRTNFDFIEDGSLKIVFSFQDASPWVFIYKDGSVIHESGEVIYVK
jgi:hypothetical protein